MADIIIRGMEMPKKPTSLTMYPDGRWNDYTDGANGEFVPLPEKHGRLIDADELERVCKEIANCEWNKKAAPYSWECAYNQFIDDEIFNAPTIVPAEGGSEDGN